MASMGSNLATVFIYIPIYLEFYLIIDKSQITRYGGIDVLYYNMAWYLYYTVKSDRL